MIRTHHIVWEEVYYSNIQQLKAILEFSLSECRVNCTLIRNECCMRSEPQTWCMSEGRYHPPWMWLLSLTSLCIFTWPWKEVKHNEGGRRSLPIQRSTVHSLDQRPQKTLAVDSAPSKVPEITKLLYYEKATTILTVIMMGTKWGMVNVGVILTEYQ